MNDKLSFDMNKGLEDTAAQSGSSIFRKCFPYRATDSDFLPSWPRRIGLFIFGVTQNALSGGLIFGWASIDQTLLSQVHGGAGLDLQQATTIFSWATSISMCAALVLGAVLDYSGPRIASVVSCWCIGLGCLIFSLSNHFVGFATGIILIGFGGPGIGNCIIHMANLFPGNENLAMSSLSGSIAFSFSIFAIFDSLWSEFEHLSFRHLFGAFALLLFVSGCGSILLFPDEPFEELVEDELSDSDNGFVSGEETPLISERSTEAPIFQTPPRKAADHERHQKLGHVSPYHGHDVPHVTFVVEQPFNSYLRDNHRAAVRTDSFRASEKSLQHGGPAVSLKDQPFWNQLTSAAYMRAFLVFLVCTFVTNFYVGTLSTELMDRQDFDADTQHDLSRWFTIIMSLGIFASLVVGWMIDRIGLEFCTALTLMFGQLQMLLILLGSENETVMVLSFISYTIFRAFLYPVFIGSLTSRLGFKYFGILLGLGFAMSGITQLLFPILVEVLQGDCHRIGEDSTSPCDHGKWQVSEMIQFIVLGMMNIVPILDYRDSVARELQIRRLLLGSSSSSLSIRQKPSYGTGGTESPESNDF